MATATILPTARTVFLDENNNPLSGGSVYMYVPNTTTPKTTWQDAGETTPNSNPIVLDGNGSCLLYGSGQYTQEVYDQSGNLIYTGLTQDVYGLITNGNNTFTGTNTFSGAVDFTGGFTLPNNFVTNNMLAEMQPNTVKVNDSASLAEPVDLALGQNTLLGRGSTGNITAITLASNLEFTGSVLGVTDIPVLNYQVITTSGHFTTPSNTLSTTSFKFTVTGAGGSGGAPTSGFGNGGGAGGTAIYIASGLTASTNYTVTVGTGGATTPEGGGPGSAGTASSIVVGTTVTANGGAAGGDTGGKAGAGGASTNGTLNLTGGDGSSSGGTSSLAGGTGGASYWGGGGAGGTNNGTNGGNGGSYGAGGGGTQSSGGGTGFSGTGANGVVVVEWTL